MRLFWNIFYCTVVSLVGAQDTYLKNVSIPVPHQSGDCIPHKMALYTAIHSFLMVIEKSTLL